MKKTNHATWKESTAEQFDKKLRFQKISRKKIVNT